MSETTNINELRGELAANEARREAARFDPQFLHMLREERDHQAGRWGDEHDRQHTLYDWTVFLTKFVGRAATAAMENEPREFERLMVKVAAVAAAAHRALYPAELVDAWSDEAAESARRSR